MFIAKYNEKRVESVFEDVDDDPQLLGTIKVPKNLKLLSERLPKSNFGHKNKE
jgi:hypothetical protein